jgi:hypothetical protein
MNRFIRILLFIVTVFLFSGYLNAQENSWEIIGTMKYPIAGGAVVNNGSETNPKFYFIGGFLGIPKKVSDWIQEYDLLKNEWNLMPFFINTPRMFLSAGLYDSTVVFFGGAEYTSPHKDALESWNFIKSTQPVIKSTNPNFERFLTNGFVKDNSLFVVGGASTNMSDTIYTVFQFDLETDQAVYKANDPLLYFSSDILSVASHDNFYFFGGVYGGFIKKTINSYSLQASTFLTQNETLVKPRAGGAAVLDKYSNIAYVVGGYDQVNKALNTVEEIRINYDGSLSVRLLGNLNYARRYPMIAIYDNELFVFGGFDEKDEVVDKIEKLTFAITSVEEENFVPTDFVLYQNFPNPFNPSTNIKFDLPKESNVAVKIYNILGEEVATLVNRVMQAGRHTVEFNASRLSSGMYIYRIEAGDFVQVKKMLLMK